MNRAQNWHRYYAPELGRYLQPDPLGVRSPKQRTNLSAGGAITARSTDLYNYVLNNPLGAIDPKGLQEILRGRMPPWFSRLAPSQGYVAPRCPPMSNSELPPPPVRPAISAPPDPLEGPVSPDTQWWRDFFKAAGEVDDSGVAPPSPVPNPGRRAADPFTPSVLD
jgi:RHS repeat-associated protein